MPEDKLLTVKETEERYKLILSSIEEGYYEVDIAGNFLFVNDAFCRITGYTKEVLQGASYKSLFSDAQQAFKEYNKVFRTGIAVKNFSRNLIRQDGSKLLAETSISLIKDESGKPVGFRGIVRDITTRKEIERDIKYQKNLFEALFANSSDAIALADKEQQIMAINQQFSRLFGYSLEEIKGKSPDEVLAGNIGRNEAKSMTQNVLTGQNIALEAVRYAKGGKAIEVSIKGVPVVIDGEVVGGYGIYTDISERKRYEEKLRFLSLHDQLTGLYNRAYFENELQRLTGSREYPISIISADLNGLKLINDTLGHGRGDDLLKVAAQALKESLRSSDILARVGGDEFVIILPGTSKAGGKSIARRISAIADKHNRDYPEMPLSISLGIATTAHVEQPLEEVLKDADDTMYRNKGRFGRTAGNRRNRVVKTMLTALAERDYIATGHAERMQSLCRKLGEACGLSSQQLVALSLLTQVHDLGYVGIPKHILFKKEPLTTKEWEILRQHPERGYRIADFSLDLAGVASLILRHHEWWDGNGYPFGLKGKDIPVECRIFAIVDAFDAMTNERPYRQTKSPAAALAEIKKCGGTQFDPELVEKFLEIMAK